MNFYNFGCINGWSITFGKSKVESLGTSAHQHKLRGPGKIRSQQSFTYSPWRFLAIWRRSFWFVRTLLAAWFYGMRSAQHQHVLYMVHYRTNLSFWTSAIGGATRRDSLDKESSCFLVSPEIAWPSRAAERSETRTLLDLSSNISVCCHRPKRIIPRPCLNIK